MEKMHRRVRMVTEGAVCIALAEILGFLPMYRMPWGGAIDLAMLPIVVYCVRWGFGPGLIAGAAHGLLQTVFEGFIAIGWESLLGDFIIAYTALGIAGLFRGRFFAGAAAACGARFLVHYAVGATVWAKYMPERFFGMTMTSPWLYSALYNGAYMLPDLGAMVIVGAILLKTPAGQYLTGKDLQ